MLKRIALSFFALFWASVAVASGITSPSNYNAANVAITGGTIVTTGIISTTGSGFFNSNRGYAINGTYALSTFGLQLGGKLVFSTVAPTIASGFGTGASIPPATANGTAAFLINVGTGTIGAGVITMPAAANGWVCSIGNNFASANAITQIDSSTKTSVTISNYLVSTGVNTAWLSGRVLQVQCTGY